MYKTSGNIVKSVMNTES